MFDPYYKWLGIPPEHQPADHYRLLGLQQFEADPDVIEAAGERQMAHMHNYKLGPQSELSQRILNEISRAKICLLNPLTKAEYDSRLRRDLARTKPADPLPQVVPPPPPTVAIEPPAASQDWRTPPAPGSPVSPAASPPATFTPRSPIEELGGFRPRHGVAPRRRRSNLGLVMVLGFIAAIVAGVGGSYFLNLDEWPQSKTTSMDELAPKPALQGSGKATQTSRPPPSPGPSKQARAVQLPQPIRNKPPASTAERQKKLPDPPNNQKQEPVLADTTAQAANQAEMSNVAKPAQGAPDSTEIRSPEAVEIEATIIDLTKSQYNIKINVAQAGIELRQLKIEAIEVTNAPFSKRLPDDGRADHGQPVRLVVRDELPKAAIELSLHGSQPLNVRVKPIIEDYDHKLYPWTQERMKALRGYLVRETRKAEAGISTLKGRIPVLQANIESLKRQPRNIYNRDSLELTQRNAEANLATATNDLRLLEVRLPLLRNQSEGFSELFALSERVHLQGRVRFRVIHQIGDETTIIAQTASP